MKIKSIFFASFLCPVLVLAACNPTNDDSKNSSENYQEFSETVTSSETFQVSSETIVTESNEPTKLESELIDQKLAELETIAANYDEKSDVKEYERFLALVRELLYSGQLSEQQQEKLDSIVEKMPEDVQETVKILKETS